jgi:hypothetical protein
MIAEPVVISCVDPGGYRGRSITWGTSSTHLADVQFPISDDELK